MPFGKTLKLWERETERLTGRVLQTNANVLVSIIVTLPKSYQAPEGTETFKDWYTDERKKREDEIWRAVCEFFKTRFAAFLNYNGNTFSNVIYACVHRDEDAPHLHYGFIPIMKETTVEKKRYKDSDGVTKVREVCSKEGTINASGVINRAVLLTLHSDLDEYLKNTVSWYRGGILLSKEEKMRHGQNSVLRELKALPPNFREYRNALNRLDSLFQAAADIEQHIEDLNYCKKELAFLSDPDNFPPLIRLVHQLLKDKKLLRSEFINNKVYNDSITAYMAYRDSLKAVGKSLDAITKDGRGKDKEGR